jgi:methionine-rich copper-binding protein CopC
MKPRLILILSLASISLARAHAFLDHAEPRVGSTNKASPSVVKIWFTEELEPAFSKVEVYDAGKREVDRRDVRVDSTDKTLMTVSVPKLGPGTYKVLWNAVAVDTHHTSGSFTFVVSP